MFEETFFEIGTKTIPGPSARSIYEIEDGLPLDDNALLSKYADEEDTLTFNVSPPLKRKREPQQILDDHGKKLVKT